MVVRTSHVVCVLQTTNTTAFVSEKQSEVFGWGVSWFFDGCGQRGGFGGLQGDGKKQ